MFLSRFLNLTFIVVLIVGVARPRSLLELLQILHEQYCSIAICERPSNFFSNNSLLVKVLERIKGAPCYKPSFWSVDNYLHPWRRNKDWDKKLVWEIKFLHRLSFCNYQHLNVFYISTSVVWKKCFFVQLSYFSKNLL